MRSGSVHLKFVTFKAEILVYILLAHLTRSAKWLVVRNC